MDPVVVNVKKIRKFSTRALWKIVEIRIHVSDLILMRLEDTKSKVGPCWNCSNDILLDFLGLLNALAVPQRSIKTFYFQLFRLAASRLIRLHRQHNNMLIYFRSSYPNSEVY